MSPTRSTVRWLAIGLIAALLAAMTIYWGNTERVEPEKVAARNLAVDPVAPSLAAGKRMFIAHCAACHQPNGRGLTGVYPPLAGSEWVNGAEDRIIRVVLHGLGGPTEVKGETFNNSMIPFRGVLSDEQIAHVLTYIRQEWGNTSAPVALEKVAAIRRATADRSNPWTAAELLAMPP